MTTLITEDSIIERGIEAEHLLANDSFVSFTKELKDLLAASVLNTEPEDTAERERLYYTNRGLSDLIGVMESYIAAKDQIALKRNAENDTKDVDYS